MSDSSLLSRVARGIANAPKTLYLNFRTLPLRDAMKLPYVVMSKTAVRGATRESMRIEGEIRTGMIRVGALKVAKRGIHVNGKTSLMVENGGSITFKGCASIGAGSSICAAGGEIELGDSFSCNNNCFLFSNEGISFDDDVLLGWNVNVRDNDGHPIYQDGAVVNESRPVHVASHVWIASYVDILKGVDIATGVVVGTRSLVTRSVKEPKSLVVGIPAHIARRNINWLHEPMSRGSGD